MIRNLMRFTGAMGVLVSAAAAGCRTMTYDERMTEVDHLYAQGSYDQAAAVLHEETGGEAGWTQEPPQQ
jgi:hypothetical protein